MDANRGTADKTQNSKQRPVSDGVLPGFVLEQAKQGAAARVPDTKRWGDVASYPQGWNRRADVAARMIEDDVYLLEIGVGAGYLKSIVEPRVNYRGLDLAPVVPGVQPFNIESDELPESHYDCIVLLGVLEYVHDAPRAAALLADAADSLVLSYCFAEHGFEHEEFRMRMGWVNGLLQEELLGMFTQRGFRLADWFDYTRETGWHQAVFKLQRTPVDPSIPAVAAGA